MYASRVILSGLFFMQGKHYYDYWWHKYMTIFKETYVLKFYIQLCDKQVVQLKTAWIWWSTPKTRTVFPLHKTCFEKLNLLSSLSILQAIQSFFLSWLYKCCDALYAWTTKETWLVFIYWLLTRSWIPMQKAQCDPYAHQSVYSPSNSNICI